MSNYTIHLWSELLKQYIDVLFSKLSNHGLLRLIFKICDLLVNVVLYIKRAEMQKDFYATPRVVYIFRRFVYRNKKIWWNSNFTRHRILLYKWSGSSFFIIVEWLICCIDWSQHPRSPGRSSVLFEHSRFKKKIFATIKIHQNKKERNVSQ